MRYWTEVFSNIFYRVLFRNRSNVRKLSGKRKLPLAEAAVKDGCDGAHTNVGIIPKDIKDNP